MRAARGIGRGIAAFALLLPLLACGGGAPPDQRSIPAELPASAREAARRLPLDGAHNFRDLGGYATSDGRTLRWGVLYRSDALADLSDDDLAYLGRLGLRRVVDFRSPLERERDEVLRRVQVDDLDRITRRPPSNRGTPGCFRYA